MYQWFGLITIITIEYDDDDDGGGGGEADSLFCIRK
jgi:hypothetical protein